MNHLANPLIKTMSVMSDRRVMVIEALLPVTLDVY